MKFYKNVVIIFSLFSLISCEKYFIASIVNNSKTQITVKIKIDNDAVDKKRKEYLEKGFLFDKENPKDYEIKIDSSDSYDIAGSMHIEPDFYDIKEMEIYSEDNIPAPDVNSNAYTNNRHDNCAIYNTTDGPDINISPDPMDPNWGGAEYTQSLVDAGYYADNEVSIAIN